MKTLNTKSIFTIAALLFAALANAATPSHCATVIEVSDGTYYDKLWMVTEPGTTDGFDNGWDGYKFLSSASYIPQIYDNTIDGKFQVSSFPTIDNNTFHFLPGTATLYKITFTHYDINSFYDGLYLVDLVAGDTIDIFENLSSFKFTATKSDLVERFKFITSLKSQNVSSDGETENTATEKGISTGNKDVEQSDLNLANNVQFRSINRNLQIANTNNSIANISIVEAASGRIVNQLNVNAGEIRILNTKFSTGLYVISTTVETENATKTILIK